MKTDIRKFTVCFLLVAMTVVSAVFASLSTGEKSAAQAQGAGGTFSGFDDLTDLSHIYRTNGSIYSYETSSDIAKLFGDTSVLSRRTRDDATFVIYKIKDITSAEAVVYSYKNLITEENKFVFSASRDPDGDKFETIPAAYSDVASGSGNDFYRRGVYSLTGLTGYTFLRIDFPVLPDEWWNYSLAGVTVVPDVSAKHDVVVTVTDSDTKEPVSGVQLRVGHEVAFTGEDGTAVIGLQAGEKSFSAVKEFYTAAEKEALITDGSTVELELSRLRNGHAFSLDKPFGLYVGKAKTYLKTSEYSSFEADFSIDRNGVTVTPTGNAGTALFGMNPGYVNFNEVRQLVFSSSGYGSFGVRFTDGNFIREKNFNNFTGGKLLHCVDFEALGFVGVKDISIEFLTDYVAAGTEEEPLHFLTFNDLGFAGEFTRFDKPFPVVLLLRDIVYGDCLPGVTVSVDGNTYVSGDGGDIPLQLTNGMHYYKIEQRGYVTADGFFQVDRDYFTQDTLNISVDVQCDYNDGGIFRLNGAVVAAIILFIVLNSALVIYYLCRKKTGTGV